MNLCICGDLHFRAFRLKNIAEAWEKTVDDMIQNQVGLCLLSGDIFDHSNIAGREASFGTIYRAFAHPLNKLLKAGVKVIACDGNHDRSTGSQKSALEPLRDLGVVYFDQLGFHQTGDILVAVLPWIPRCSSVEKQAMIDQIKATFKNHDGLKILMAHCDVAGSVTPHGHTLIGGSFEFTNEQLESVGADLMGLCHVHNRQGCYVGALTQLNFGEEGNPTGYDLYKIMHGKIEKEFRQIDSPKYQTIDIGLAHDPEDDNLRNLRQNSSIGLMPAGYTKLRFHRDYTPEEIKPYLDNPNIIIEKVVERQVSSRTEEALTAQDDPIELLRTFIKLNPEGLKGIEDELVEAAKELLTEVR